jgi:hypothetical protein
MRRNRNRGDVRIVREGDCYNRRWLTTGTQRVQSKQKGNAHPENRRVWHAAQALDFVEAMAQRAGHVEDVLGPGLEGFEALEG